MLLERYPRRRCDRLQRALRDIAARDLARDVEQQPVELLRRIERGKRLAQRAEVCVIAAARDQVMNDEADDDTPDLESSEESM